MSPKLASLPQRWAVSLGYWVMPGQKLGRQKNPARWGSKGGANQDSAFRELERLAARLPLYSLEQSPGLKFNVRAGPRYRKL
jgi:hypothetical protein